MTQKPPTQSLSPAPAPAPSSIQEENRAVAQFLIEMPVDLAQEVADFMTGFMASRNIPPFDPVRNMVAINSQFVQTDVHYGDQVGELLEKINEYLRETGNGPAVPEDHEQWTLQQTYEFLALANTEFNWNDRMTIECAWWEDGESWRELTREYSNLFPQKTEEGLQTAEDPASEDHQPEVGHPQMDIRYEIKIPADRITLVAEVLKSIGIHFDTTNDMLGAPSGDNSFRAAGNSTEQLLTSVSYLWSRWLTPLIPTDHEN